MSDDSTMETAEVIDVDTRTSDERVEDLAFENRIKTLIHARKFDEMQAVMVIYGSAYDERFAAPVDRPDATE